MSFIISQFAIFSGEKGENNCFNVTKRMRRTREKPLNAPQYDNIYYKKACKAFCVKMCVVKEVIL